MCDKYPGRLALGVDARNGLVATEGWLEQARRRRSELVEQFTGAPLAAIIYTDIATDGMLAGPNVAAMARDAGVDHDAGDRLRGVTTAADVAELAAAGLAGAIVGRALYAGTLTLRDALRAAERGPGPRAVVTTNKLRIALLSAKTTLSAFPEGATMARNVADIRNIALCGHGHAGQDVARGSHVGRRRRSEGESQRSMPDEHLRLRRRGEEPQVFDRSERRALRSCRQSVST